LLVVLLIFDFEEETSSIIAKKPEDLC